MPHSSGGGRIRVSVREKVHSLLNRWGEGCRQEDSLRDSIHGVETNCAQVEAVHPERRNANSWPHPEGKTKQPSQVTRNSIVWSQLNSIIGALAKMIKLQQINTLRSSNRFQSYFYGTPLCFGFNWPKPAAKGDNNGFFSPDNCVVL